VCHPGVSVGYRGHVAFFRPFRRNLKPLGTEGGNPSETDEVMAQGPPILPGQTTRAAGLLAGVGYWDEEREAAVHADLDTDIASDFDSLGAAEDREHDALSSPDSPPSDD
jgi:hypothetical protein